MTTDANIIDISHVTKFKPHPAWMAENEQYDHTNILNGFDEQYTETAVRNWAIQSGRCMRRSRYQGTPKSPDTFVHDLSKFASPIETVGPKLSSLHGSLWAFDDGLIHINQYLQNESSVNIHSMYMYALTDERISWFEKWTAEHYTPHKEPVSTKRNGSVYMLTNTRSKGMAIQHIGKITEPFVRENYSAAVLAQYDRAINDLNSESPSGRIVILDGCPGTGKTWLVRSMTCAADCAFVFVPPALAKQMGDPSLIPVLVSARNAHGRLALVFEDADQLLSPRQGLTMDSLATILNLGDGILGELMGVRVICTTNSPVKHMDKALLRPGRLSARIAVNPLTSAEWHPIYTRLTGKKSRAKGKKTLADVYAMAREV